MKKITGYRAKTQTTMNLAWFLPRPKPDRYKGGMPLHCEGWLFDLAADVFDKYKSELNIMNLFCGMNSYGLRVDINPKVKPHILCDVHELSLHVDLRKRNYFDIILADPPYSNQESKELYGTGDIKYKKWTTEADKFLKPGGLLIVYHKYVMPNPNPKKYRVVKRVFIGNRSYHLPRVAIYFQKKKRIKNNDNS